MSGGLQDQLNSAEGLQIFLEYKGELAIVPKKFKPTGDSDGLTFSAYKTQQNNDHWARREVEGLPMIPRLIVGYLFIEEMTDVKIWIAYPYGRDLTTRMLIPNQDGQVVGIHIPAPDATEDEDPGFLVKPKAKRGRGQQGTE